MQPYDDDLPEVVLDVSVSLDNIPTRHLPPIQRRGNRLMIPFGNATLWLRDDQAEELLVRLAEHLAEPQRVIAGLMVKHCGEDAA